MQPSSPNNEQGTQNSNPIQPTLEESEVLNLDETNVSPLRQQAIDHISVETPADNSCMFWAVSLSLLAPLTRQPSGFRDMFVNLFGEVYEGLAEQARKFLENYTGDVDYLQQSSGLVLRMLNNHVLRQRLADWMLKNKNRLSSENIFISIEHDEDFDSRVNSIRNANTWGGESELLALSYMLGVTINIYSENNEVPQTVANLNPAQQTQIELVFARFSEKSEKQNHYRYRMAQQLLNQSVARNAQESDQDKILPQPKAGIANAQQKITYLSRSGVTASLLGSGLVLLDTLFSLIESSISFSNKEQCKERTYPQMWIGFLRSMSAGISLLILITASIMDRCKSYEIIKTDNNKLLIKDSDKFASHHQKNKKANISLLVGDGIFGTLALTLALSLIIDACVSIGLCINARNDQKEFLNSNWITDIICKSLGLTGEVVWLIADGTTHLLQHRLHTQQIIPFLGNNDIIEAINSNPQQAENRYSAFAHPNVQAATANQPIEDEQANGIIQDVSKTDDKKDQPSFN